MNEEQVIKYYYKVNEQGEIIQSLHIPNPSDEIKADYLETEREIVVAPNGKLMFADEIANMNFAPALEEIKEAKITELKSARDAEELSPISYGGYMWDFDDKAQQRINGAIIALADGGELVWTSADNREIRGVNADDLKNVIKSAAVRSNMVHVKYRELKAQVEQAETQEQVEAVVW